MIIRGDFGSIKIFPSFRPITPEEEKRLYIMLAQCLIKRGDPEGQGDGDGQCGDSRNKTQIFGIINEHSMK